MSAILKEKPFPSGYPDDAVKVLKAMSFTEGKALNIVGSQALRSQLYAGDYDGYEIVETEYPTDKEALDYLVSKFQSMIKELKSMKNVYIGDIKAGVIEEWRVIPTKKLYNLRATMEKVEDLYKKKIISAKEVKETLAVLKARPTKLDTLVAREKIKFHKIRWTPETILRGSQKLRDGRTYTLQEAFSSPIMTKLDVIALIQGRYTDLSVIYEFHNGSKALNPDEIDPEKSLKESIALFTLEGNTFKVIKRKFALAKLKNDTKAVKRYSSILNSELGKLYIIYSDVKTLIDLLEDHSIPEEKLSKSIKDFRYRIAHIYSLEDHLKTEKALLSLLDKALTESNPLPLLNRVESLLLRHLSSATNLYGKGLEHYPII